MVVTLALVAAGLVAGFVDSIAGGGGLITLPAMILVVGAGPAAVGTNKIVGAAGALVALAVYARRGHVALRPSVAFVAWVGAGALLGSRLQPLVPPRLFPLLLGITAPLLLWVVFRKELWLAAERGAATAGPRALLDARVALCGVVCGLYDGIWGPGGGTFMFLALHLFVGLPLLGALAAAKLANSVSALTALASYAQAGYVRWGSGAALAGGAAAGALLGARSASTYAARLVRPGLAVVAGLLVLKVLRG